MTAELAFSIVILTAAAFVHGLTGVGFGMTAMSLFSVTPGAYGESAGIVGVAALFVYVLLFSVTSRKTSIRWYEVVSVSAGGAAGVAAGYGFLLIVQNPSVLKVVIGAAITALSLLSLFQHRIDISIRKTCWSAVMAGFFGGFVFAVFIAGGVLIALYLYTDTEKPAEMKLTLQVILIVLGLLRIIVFRAGHSDFTPGVSGILIFSLLPITGALLTGHYFSTKVRQAAFRKALFIFLSAAGTGIAVLGGTGLI